MSVLERLASPLRSRDASARVRAVQKHPVTDTRTLAELARSDPDGRVRKEAVRRIEAPRVLLELADNAGDDTTRRLAKTRGQALLAKIAADDRDLEESRRALGLLGPARHVADVAVRARFDPIRVEALERLIALPPEDGERDPALAAVARRAAEPAPRSRALDAIGSPAGLLLVAVSAEDRESALAAVRRLEDPELLLSAANNAASRSVRRLARRRADERLPTEHPDRIRQRDRTLAGILDRIAEGSSASPDEHRGLLEEAERVIGEGPVARALSQRFTELRANARERNARDSGADRRLLPDASPSEQPASRPPADAAPTPLPARVETILSLLEDPEGVLSISEVEALERECRELLGQHPGGRAPANRAPTARLHTAVAAARAAALDRKRQRVHEFELAEMVDRAATLAKSLGERVAAADRARARKELGRLTRRFERIEPGENPDAERFQTAVRAATAALERADTTRKRETQQGEERIEALGTRLAALEEAEPLPLDDAEAALRDLAVLRNTPPRWRQAGPERQARFQRIQAALMPRLREAREIREWRHWSNLEEQAELIRRAKALRELKDLPHLDREISALERAWRQARHTARGRGQELWEEWEELRGELLARVAPVREAAEREAAAKLATLTALAERAETIADAGDPRQAADMRSLMPEWKASAKGTGKRAEALWKRFREANNRYFDALKTARKKRHEEFTANIPIREELIQRARTLVEAEGDEEAVRSTVRELMLAWKNAPPVPRRQSERLWEAFRGACDKARDRFREAAAAEESVGGAATPDAVSDDELSLRSRIPALRDLPAEERRDEALALWDEFRRLQRSSPGDGVRRETETALFAALRDAVAAEPDRFADTRLDQQALAARLASLLQKLEALGEPTSQPSPEAGTQETGTRVAGTLDLAERLRRSLQAGRAADRGAALREDAAKARELRERARASGPALADPATATLRRIEELAREVIRRAPDVNDSADGERKKRPPRRSPRRSGRFERRSRPA